MAAAASRARVLLVGPTALDFSGRPVKTRRLHLPGLTMPILAAVTPPDTDVRIIMETVEEVPFDEHWDLVGLTGMGSGVVRAWEIGDEFRRRGVKVVIGGIGPSLAPPSLMLEHADSVVVGEAEEIWPVVVRDALAGRLQSVYRAGTPPPIESLPEPRYDLLNRSKLGLWRPVQATRGCPLGCAFCSVTAFGGGRYRKRPIDQVLRDVRLAKKNGSRYVAFIDDNIAVDFDYAAALWEALVPEKITWMSQASLHIADRPDMLALSRRSGCRLLSLGIESLNPESLESLRKGWHRPQDYAGAVRRIRAAGIDVSTEMIIGVDGDDDTVFERTLAFLLDNRISVPRVHILTPIPGTPLYDRLEREGRILHRDYGRYSGGQVVFRPARMEAEALQLAYWALYRRLFTWRSILHRVLPNPASLPPFMRAVVAGANLHYRDHVRRHITPGIV